MDCGRWKKLIKDEWWAGKVLSGWMFLLVPANWGSPGQRVVKWLCVYVNWMQVIESRQKKRWFAVRACKPDCQCYVVWSSQRHAMITRAVTWHRSYQIDSPTTEATCSISSKAMPTISSSLPVCICSWALNHALPSNRQYPSCDACLEVKREDNQNCSMLAVLCTTVGHTQMNSSYSSLDWVLSHCVPDMTYNVFGGTLNLAQPTMVFPFTACLHLCRGTASQCVHCVVSICTVDHRASEAHTFWCENMARFLTTQCSCPSFIGCTCDQHTKWMFYFRWWHWLRLMNTSVG